MSRPRRRAAPSESVGGSCEPRRSRADEFIRRFLIHVLPRGFHRIRHYGLLASSAHKDALALARRLLGVAAPLAEPKTTEDLASDKRNRAAYTAVAALKRSLREPDSAVFEKVRVDDAAETVCIVYRARNGFGGMGIGHVLYRSGIPSERAADWNRRCAHKVTRTTAEPADIPVPAMVFEWNLPDLYVAYRDIDYSVEYGTLRMETPKMHALRLRHERDTMAGRTAL